MALKKKFSRAELIDAIGDQNIFEYYFEQEINLNRCYQSVLREDNNFSTGFYLSQHGHLVYNDFATGAKLDCVAFVAAKFGVTYYKAIDIIAVDFGLLEGVKSSNKVAKIIKRTPLVKQERVIKIIAIPYTAQHLEFWAKYGVIEAELKENDVFAVDEMSINDWVVPKADNNIRFAYLAKGTEKSYLKIYSPYDKEWKWVSSVPMEYIYGLNELPHMSKTLLIVKSQKERIIAKKIFSDVIAIGAENTGAINKEIITQLKVQYDRILYFGDNDKPGLKFCEYMTAIGAESFHFPENFIVKFSIKDIADFVAKWEIGNFEKWCKLNKLL